MADGCVLLKHTEFAKEIMTTFLSHPGNTNIRSICGENIELPGWFLVSIDYSVLTSLQYGSLFPHELLRQ
jgi:hypothetical protein